MNNKNIGIVLLNYQTWNDTLSVIQNLEKQKNVNLYFSVVDNDSPNGSFEKLQDALKNYDSSKLVLTKAVGNLGYAKGNNIGLRQLDKYNCDYVVILNNDVVLENENILSILCAEYENLNSPGFIAPRQLDIKRKHYHDIYRLPSLFDDIMKSSIILQYFQILYRKLERQLIYSSSVNQPVDIFNGSFLFISYPLFKRLDYFDEETFLFGEERFWGKKMKLAKKQCYVINSIEYIHAHSKTINKYVNADKKFKYFMDAILSYTEKYRTHGKMKKRLLQYLLSYSMLELKIRMKVRALFR